MTAERDRRALEQALAGYIMPYRLIFTLLRETGLRVGEVLALNVGDVDALPRSEGLCRQTGLCDEWGAPRYTIRQTRHTVATELFEQGHRLETVQRRLGHTDIRTTMGYAQVSDAWVRAELEGGPL